MLNPWETDQVKDYGRIMKDFGIDEFDIGALPGDVSIPRLFREGIVFGQRGFKTIVDRMKRKEMFAVLTGLMPSGRMHLGHKMVIDEVIYSKGNMKSEEIKEITNLCNEVGVIFRLQSQLSPLRTLKLQMEALNDVNQLSLADHPSNSISQFLKYVSDLYFSFFMLILLFPVFLFIAIIIKIDSPGPVFFKQERIGLRGRKFWLYKFRTMVINAEEVLEKLKEKNEMDGPVFKIKDDPRITKVGRFLRKSGLDELPQLYNVFKGEMSLIGPRPPLEKEVKQYKRWQLRRLSVKPGITCTWQIIPNRNSVNFENWMKLDLQYIDNWSLSKDIRLFFRTIATFFTATGH